MSKVSSRIALKQALLSFISLFLFYNVFSHNAYLFCENESEIKAVSPAVEIVEHQQGEPIGTQEFIKELKNSVRFDGPGPHTIGLISVDDMKSGISDATWIYVNAALEYYKKVKPSCIILRLNTPGGEVYAAQRISDALKEMDTQYTIPIIAFIDSWAISAGAMLAYSCRFITVAKGASMGAAEPVFMGQEGKMEEASEKINSALRSEFENRARFFGRNPLIAKAMVDKDVILVKRGRDIVELNTEDQIKESDQVISAKGKLLTLNAEKLIELGVADFEFTPQKTQELTEEENTVGTYPVSKTVWVQIPFFQEHSDMTFDVFSMDWRQKFIAFLALPQVSSVLLFVLMICIYLEISSGGFGLPAACGIITLFFLTLPSFAMQAITWLEPILFVFGLGLALLEIFFFPTLGILGFVGTILMLIGIIGILVPGISSISYDGNALNSAGEYVITRLAWLSGMLIFGALVIAYLSKNALAKMKLVHRIVLNDTPQLLEPMRIDLEALIGKQATVVSALRPAGKVRIGQDDYDAQSTGSFLEEGTLTTVVRVEGKRIFVEELLS